MCFIEENKYDLNLNIEAINTFMPPQLLYKQLLQTFMNKHSAWFTKSKLSPLYADPKLSQNVLF